MGIIKISFQICLGGGLVLSLWHKNKYYDCFKDMLMKILSRQATTKKKLS